MERENTNSDQLKSPLQPHKLRTYSKGKMIFIKSFNNKNKDLGFNHQWAQPFQNDGFRQQEAHENIQNHQNDFKQSRNFYSHKKYQDFKKNIRGHMQKATAAQPQEDSPSEFEEDGFKLEAEEENDQSSINIDKNNEMKNEIYSKRQYFPRHQQKTFKNRNNKTVFSPQSTKRNNYSRFNTSDLENNVSCPPSSNFQQTNTEFQNFVLNCASNNSKNFFLAPILPMFSDNTDIPNNQKVISNHNNQESSPHNTTQFIFDNHANAKKKDPKQPSYESEDDCYDVFLTANASQLSNPNFYLNHGITSSKLDQITRIDSKQGLSDETYEPKQIFENDNPFLFENEQRLMNGIKDIKGAENQQGVALSREQSKVSDISNETVDIIKIRKLSLNETLEELQKQNDYYMDME